MKYLLALSLILIGFNASASTVVCNTCGDFASKAKAAGQGTHYIVNNLNGEVRKFQVIMMRGGVPFATEKTVEQEVKNYTSFVAQKNGQTQVSLDNRGDFPQNGYELVEFPQLGTRVGAWIKEGGWGLTQDFLYYINAVGSIVGFNAGAIEITIRANMADGSTALFVYNHTTQSWQVVKGQTRDSSNNIIPEKPEDVSGGTGSSTNYTFQDTPNGEADLINFIQRLNLLGVPITGSVGGGGIVVLTCTPTGCFPQVIY